jgi:RNA-directed DNA polymerase
MMHGRGKSDEAIVAVKPANKAERSAAEPVEPRAETKGASGRTQARRRSLLQLKKRPGR